MPALLKSTSIRPKRRATRSAIATVCVSSVTSTSSATESGLRLEISSTVRRAASRSMSATTTRAPSSAKRRALAWPIPEPAPVIKQTLSLRRSPICGLSYMLKLRCLSTCQVQIWAGRRLLGGTELELYAVRRILEAAAAALAAGRIDAQEKVDLGQSLERMRAAHSVEELVEADVAFHALIAKAAGNTVLTSLLASLSTRTMRIRLWHGRAADDALEETREEHRRIYEALIGGDPELARATATAHIASGERWLRGQLRAGNSA